MSPIRIANAAGFLGDQIDAPRRLVEQAQVDYLTIEHLAELTLSILAAQKQKDPAAGFARDFLDIAASLAPALYLQSQLRVITNSGGVNVRACATESGALLTDRGLAELPIACVTGDDLLSALEELMQAGCEFAHFETGQPLAELKRPIVSANVYLGARPIAEALAGGARMVLTGRVADASLTLGPAAHEFGWRWDDWNTLAGASVAGHLIECGAQVTGGYSIDWRGRSLADVGYPIAEVDERGDCVLTKPGGTGGAVNRFTVAEQLLYEIGDPAAYLTPDVAVDFTMVKLQEVGPDRVKVAGATGRAAPETLKVSLAYRDGYTASGQLLVYGEDCVEKAKACAEIIWARLKQAGCEPAHGYSELLGAGGAALGELAPPAGLREVVLRMAVRDERRPVVERFTKEIAPLVTSGPAGLAGYASARSPVRPVFAYWPTLVPRGLVEPAVEIRTASEWGVF